MSKSGWRMTYMARLMTEHGATLRDAQEHFGDVKKLSGICYEDDPVRVADEEARLFGFEWNDWTPSGPGSPIPLKCHPPGKPRLRSNTPS